MLDVSFFNEIRALLRRGTPGFNTLELKILRAVEVQLPPPQAERLQRRIQQVNLVQRLDGGREVNSYQMRGGHPAFDESTRLTDSTGEHAFAKFAFKSSRGEQFSGQMWLVNGFFFSLEFDNATEQVIDNQIRDLTVTLQRRG
jgi:tryptophanase